MQVTDKCQVCGKEYKYCNKCNDYHNWREVCCSSECYKIYLIITQHRLGITDDSETVKLLNAKGINLGTINSLNVNDITKNYILKVLQTVKSTKNKK